VHGRRPHLLEGGYGALRPEQALRRVVAWLKREQSKYNLWPAQKLLWAETIKYFPKLEAGLTKAQAAKPPMPDFDFGMPSTSTAPEPDFS
jgi:hypothetical protein